MDTLSSCGLWSVDVSQPVSLAVSLLFGCVHVSFSLNPSLCACARARLCVCVCVCVCVCGRGGFGVVEFRYFTGGDLWSL